MSTPRKEFWTTFHTASVTNHSRSCTYQPIPSVFPNQDAPYTISDANGVVVGWDPQQKDGQDCNWAESPSKMNLSSIHIKSLEAQAPNLGTLRNSLLEVRQIWATQYLYYYFLSNNMKEKQKINKKINKQTNKKWREGGKDYFSSGNVD